MRWLARMIGWQLQKVPQRASYRISNQGLRGWTFYRIGLGLWNWGSRGRRIVAMREP